MNKAKEEYKRYLASKQEIYLAQAGEKLWNAYTILMELMSKTIIRSHQKLKEVVAKMYTAKGSELVLRTYRNAYDLHKFFYRGWTDDITEIVSLYEETEQSIRLLYSTYC